MDIMEGFDDYGNNLETIVEKNKGKLLSMKYV
jgi:hypothetical protein